MVSASVSLVAFWQLSKKMLPIYIHLGMWVINSIEKNHRIAVVLSSSIFAFLVALFGLVSVHYGVVDNTLFSLTRFLDLFAMILICSRTRLMPEVSPTLLSYRDILILFAVATLPQISEFFASQFTANSVIVGYGRVTLLWAFAFAIYYLLKGDDNNQTATQPQ